MSLHKLQTTFMRSVFAKEDAAIATYLDPTGISAARRMAIYRNNVYVALTRALEAIYPVIMRLVGEEFFRFAARHYIDAYPSPSGDLNRFGAHFAKFLHEFEHVAQLVYLPDVARLEWCCHQAYLATDDTPLDLQTLAAIPPQDYGQLRFRLNSAAQLLSSVWPVDAIWRVNQADYDGDQAVDLDTGGVKLLSQRHQRRMLVTALGETEWRFLSALNDRQTLEVAYERALLAAPDTDLGALLRTYVAQATLTAFFLQPQ